LPGVVYAWKIHDNITSGILDAYFSGTARDFWIEFKFAEKLPKSINLVTRTHVPCLSGKQLRWIDGRYAEGRNVGVILSDMKRSIILLNRDWYNTIDTTTMPLTRQDVIAWITHQATESKILWNSTAANSFRHSPTL